MKLNMLPKNLARLATAALAVALLSGCAGPFYVKPEEKSVKEVVQRWAKENDKSLKWDIEDLGLVEAEFKALNDELYGSHDITEAVSRFLNTAERGRLRLAQVNGEPRPDSVMACIYNNSVHVTYHRSAAIPCSKSITATFK
ncbi:hypothetical protein LC612_38880 [Nostoc sp. CHAB 5834]|nr:hypothetical protein [Nostoc sp. CHAB 5834]